MNYPGGNRISLIRFRPYSEITAAIKLSSSPKIVQIKRTNRENKGEQTLKRRNQKPFNPLKPFRIMESQIQLK